MIIAGGHSGYTAQVRGRLGLPERLVSPCQKRSIALEGQVEKGADGKDIRKTCRDCGLVVGVISPSHDHSIATKGEGMAGSGCQCHDIRKTRGQVGLTLGIVAPNRDTS